MAKKQLLFVCLGNICRSPTGEAVMKSEVSKRGLQEDYFIDSAGTIAHHAGEEADPRMKEHALRRGVKLDSIARQVTAADFQNFDYIFAMDKKNFNALKEMASSESERKKIYMTADFCEKDSHKSIGEVPDPYFGGHEGFELVLDLLEDACGNLIEQLESGKFN